VESVQGLRGGAVVLMVGAFEKFAREAMTEHVTPFAAIMPRKPISALPVKMQVAVTFKSMDLAMRGPRYAVKGTKENRLPDVFKAAELIAAGRVDADAVGFVEGNIDADGLASLLKGLGMEDPFSKLRPYFDAEWNKAEAQQFVRDKLTSI